MKEEEREEEVEKEGLSIPKEASVRDKGEDEGEVADAREVEEGGAMGEGEEPVGKARAIDEDEVEGGDVGGMSLRPGESTTEAPTPPKAIEEEEDEEGPSLSSPQ